MKIRNGFVSNSSSSSFILSYDKSKVLTDPKQIVEFVKNQPDTPVIFRGWDCGEGDDIFTLSEEQKSLIRMFSKEFIKQNTGTTKKSKYEYNSDKDDYDYLGEEDVPKIAVYPNALLTEDQYFFHDPDVDMSDFGPRPADWHYIPDAEKTAEDVAQEEYAEKWYKEQNNRIREARKAYRVTAIGDAKEGLVKEGITSENVSAEFVDVSNRSCDDDYCYSDEFAYRYLTDTDPYVDSNYYTVKKFKAGKPRPFAVVHSVLYEDKKDIMYFVEHMDPNTKCYLLWTDPVVNTVDDYETTQYDFFEVGEEEKNLLIEHKDAFMENNKKCVFFVNATVTAGDDGQVLEGKITTLYGKVVIIPKGEDLRDFKKCATK